MMMEVKCNQMNERVEMKRRMSTRGREREGEKEREKSTSGVV